MTLDFFKDGHAHMVADIRMLEDAERGEPHARVYTWSDTWVTLGRNQKPEDALRDLSVNHIVRPTGGAAVLHGHDITVSLARPLADLECSPREVKKAYFGLVYPLVKALNKLKVKCVLGIDVPKRDRMDSHYCFASKSDYDILNVLNGEKVCGCAMKITDRAALLQASIPVSIPKIDPHSILKDYVPTPIQSVDLMDFERVYGKILLNY